MSKKTVIFGSFVILCLVLLISYFAQARSSSKMIRVDITSDGRFVPDRILVKQDTEVIFRVTASQSNELT